MGFANLLHEGRLTLNPLFDSLKYPFHLIKVRTFRGILVFHSHPVFLPPHFPLISLSLEYPIFACLNCKLFHYRFDTFP